MSRLMGDLNKLSETRKVESSIIVQDVEEEKKAPIANNHKTVYFIGFLIALVVALSAFSMTLSLEALSRIESVEEITDSTRTKILAWREDSEMISASLRKTFKKQGSQIQDLQTFIAEQNEEELARIDDLKGRVKELKVTIRDREAELEGLTSAHDTLKASVEDSIEDLKIANKLILEKYVLLNDKVKKMIDRSVYLYSTY